MTKFRTFPHRNINVKDESAGVTALEEILPLHRPIFFVRGERGEPGVPVWGEITEQTARLGSGTFDRLGPYYGHSTLFAEKAIAGQRAFLVRICDSAAKAASLVLECLVYDKDVQQYETDAQNVRTVDENGDWVEVNGVTEPGIVVSWRLRALTAGEEADPGNITAVEADVNGDMVKTYPILVMRGSSPGVWGDLAGVKLAWDPDSDRGTAEEMAAEIFTITLLQTQYGLSTPSTIFNTYEEPTVEFTWKEDTTSSTTMRRFNIDEVLRDEYNSADVPFEFFTYPENVQEIGTRLLAVEDMVKFPELDGKPFMANLFTGKNPDSAHYPHMLLDNAPADAIILDSDVVQYMSGGSDGDMTDEKFEELCQLWLTGSEFPAITDEARFPITHLYDSGFATKTKESLINFMGVTPNLRPIISTQVFGAARNTASEDQAAGAFLKSKAILHPDSLIHGTKQFRTSIFQQCGALNEVTTFKADTIPATLNSLVKRVDNHNAPYVKGNSKGLPASDVSVLKNINWMPSSDDLKQASWDACLNYMQHYDMTRYHYPDTVTVYDDKTSLLSDEDMADYITYAKHIVRTEWAKFSGRNDPINTLFGLIKKSMTRAISTAFGSFVRFEVTPYQTEQDRQLGYALSISLAMYGTVPNRVWNVTIPVRRDTEDQ